MRQLWEFIYDWIGAFSPTDLPAAALGSCMLTVMGIAARKHHVDFKGTTVHVEKEMVADPLRRIGKISVVFKMAKGVDPNKRALLKTAALNCPVHKSLNANVETPARFEYPD